MLIYELRYVYPDNFCDDDNEGRMDIALDRSSLHLTLDEAKAEAAKDALETQVDVLEVPFPQPINWKLVGWTDTTDETWEGEAQDVDAIYRIYKHQV